MQKYLSFLNQKKQRLKTSVWHSKRYFFVNYTVSKMIRELGLDAKNAAAGYWLGFPLPSCFCCQMVNCSWWPSLGCPPEQRCHSTPQHTLNKDLHFQVLLDQFLPDTGPEHARSTNSETSSVLKGALDNKLLHFLFDLLINLFPI